MPHPAIAIIERRISANLFDPDYQMSVKEIKELVRLATRAPSAYNLQNWRFIAVQSDEARNELRKMAYDQAKVSDAAVTFIICGQLPDHARLAVHLLPFVASGHMSQATVSAWGDAARSQYSDPRIARDEAIRSATLGAATMMIAAEAMGLVSGPMVGFNADAVARRFSLRPDEVPVMLLSVGRAAADNWPQKPRRPLLEVLQIS